MFDAIRKFLIHHGGTENTEKTGDASVVRTNPYPAGVDPIALLRKVVAGLTYPSESDEPFDLVRWENPEGRDVERVVGERVGKGRKVKRVSVDDFFSALKGAEDAARYEALGGTIESVLDRPEVFRVGEGEVRVDVYVLGTLKSDHSVVGVHTVSVET